MNKRLLFDAHTHFNDETYEKNNINIKNIIKEANKEGVGYFLNCAFSLESSKVAIKQSEQFDNVYAAIGIHPNDISNHKDSDYLELEELAKNKHVVAIGEVGLDYFYTIEKKLEQKESFIKQIKIAKKYNLPLMMHIRDKKDNYDAYDDVIEILKEFNIEKKIVHCFSANIKYAKKFIDLGCLINIGGAVTFKNAKELQEAATWIPINKMLLETDAPYLTPHPFRGEMNFSKHLVLTAKKIAELKNISFEEVVENTTSNAFKIFNIN